MSRNMKFKIRNEEVSRNFSGDEIERIMDILHKEV